MLCDVLPVAFDDWYRSFKQVLNLRALEQEIIAVSFNKLQNVYNRLDCVDFIKFVKEAVIYLPAALLRHFLRKLDHDPHSAFEAVLEHCLSLIKECSGVSFQEVFFKHHPVLSDAKFGEISCVVGIDTLERVVRSLDLY